MEDTTDPLKQLTEQLEARNRAQLRIETLVRIARQRGKTWEQIGRSLAMSKQAVWEQYRYLDKFLA